MRAALREITSVLSLSYGSEAVALGVPDYEKFWEEPLNVSSDAKSYRDPLQPLALLNKAPCCRLLRQLLARRSLRCIQPTLKLKSRTG